MNRYPGLYKVDDATRELIESVVAAHRDGEKIEVHEIFVEIDEDGKEGLSIGLFYEYSETPIDSRKTFDMLCAISEALIASGDYRIPYVENHFDDRQAMKGLRVA